MQAIIVDFEQGSEQWKSWRRNGIGASDAPVIQEVSPFKTLLQLWEEKIEGTEQIQNMAMRRGTEKEADIRLEMSKEYYSAYQPVCMQSKDHEWMIASLDGWDAYADYPIIEIKCPSDATHEFAVNGEIPECYFPQLQHQMAVAGVDICLYVSYNTSYPNHMLATVPCKKEEWYCKALIEREYRFWESVVNFDPPAPTDKDLVKVNDAGALSAAREYIMIAEQMKKLEEAEKAVHKTLIEKAGHPRALIGGLKVSRIIRQGNVQYSKIPALEGLDLSPFRGKPIESWRISQQ